MSMVTLTILQLAGIFCAYLLVTVGLPAFVFGQSLRGHRMPERFLLYFMTGNFYVMNLVFALQLLKISHPITLIAGTLVPAAALRIRLNQIPVRRNFSRNVEYVRRILGGQMGARTAATRFLRRVREQLLRLGKWLCHILVFRFVDCVLTAALLALLWWMYGRNLLHFFGYKASDLLVHNYWINALCDNHIFVAGVYPYGFHAVLYYLHAVFGIEIFVLLRVFAFVQNVMLFISLLAVFRLCCKSRYIPYVGLFLFAAGNCFRDHTYSRYYATLPQEFGILFIAPAMYFLIAFFEARRQELEELTAETRKKFRRREQKWLRRAARQEARLKKREQKAARRKAALERKEERRTRKRERRGLPKAERKDAARRARRAWADGMAGRVREFLFGRERKRRANSWICLAGFCMSFSMTLAVHFYGTMVAGLFCLAAAAGYGLLLFRRQYFFSVLKAGLASVAIAVLPMLLAFLGGTPLQGSLGWGLEIIMGKDSNADQEETAKEDAAAVTSDELPPNYKYELPEGVSPGEPYTIVYEGKEITVYQAVDENGVSSPFGGAGQSVGERVRNLPARLRAFVGRAVPAIGERLASYVFQLPSEADIVYLEYAFGALLALGLFYQIVRHYCYGAMLLSVGIYMAFLCVLLCAGVFGLPALMDSNRASIYFAYSCPMALVLLADGVLSLPFFFWRGRAARWMGHVLHTLSLCCVLLTVHCTAEAGMVREPRDPAGQEMNEAVTCLTNIIREEKDFTWTIVSANDEMRMGQEHGYHYETITFLEDMEELTSDTLIRIPTSVVYFYIEKIPLDYNVTYENSGQSISEKGAAKRLPANSGIGMYQGEKRWILMSRMYYWAQCFAQKYPDELQVYLETDQFVCYRLEQNPYRLFNFALDYGYNNRYDRQEKRR